MALNIDDRGADIAKLRRLAKSDDFKELQRLINDICTDLYDVRNVDRSNTEADVAGRIYAYDAMQELMALVIGAEQVIDTKSKGNNNYT